MDLNLERREFKYLVSAEVIPLLREQIRGACVLDKHARLNGRYAIRSLYLDTDDLRLYHANDREEPERFKARIRSYPGTNGPVFFEIKRRTMDVIRKTRFPVAPDNWQSYLDITHPDARTSVHHERFLSLLYTYHLKPKVLVEYQREAYKSMVDDYARVTIDTAISVQRCEEYTLEADDRRWRRIDNPIRTWSTGSVHVIELKWSNSVPRWMSDLVQRLNMIRYSFSKYCYGVLEEQSLPVKRHTALGWT